MQKKKKAGGYPRLFETIFTFSNHCAIKLNDQ